MDRPPLRLHADPHSPELSEAADGGDGPRRGSTARERDLDRIAGTGGSRSFAVALGSIIPLLMEAVENDRAWLKDFADETVRIDADLYDVLLAYQQLRRPAAA